MSNSSNDGRPDRESASNFTLAILEGLFDVIAHPTRTTTRILKMPFCFGQHINNSQRVLQDSVRYNVESVAVLILLSNLIGGRLAVHLLPEFPHSEELEGILYAFGAIATGLCGYLAVCILKLDVASLNRTVAAYTYWFGLIWLFCVVAVLLEKYQIDPDSRLGSLLGLPITIAALLLFVFLIRWIADVNNIGRGRAFLSFCLGIILFNIIFRPLFFVVNLFLKKWHLVINPY